MKRSDAIWGIFVATGSIDAYLLYLDYIRNERTENGIVNGGVLGTS